MNDVNTVPGDDAGLTASEAARRLQRDHVGGAAVGLREDGRELQDPAHLRATECVDRLVRVTDGDEVAPIAREGP